MLLIVGTVRAADFADTRPATAESEPLITSAADLRALGTEQAARRLPVRVRGVLTYISNQPNLLFLQDATGGVCVVGPRDPAIRRLLRPGALVEAEGVTNAGRSVPYVSPKGREPLALSVLDNVPPATPKRVTIADLLSPRSHGELVEVQGVVRAVRTESFGPAQDALVVAIAAGGQRLDVAYLAWGATANLPAQWVGAGIRVRGVFNAAVPDKQQVAAMRLLVGAMRDFQVVSPATQAAALPVTPVARVEPSGGRDAVRHRVQGVATLQVPGQGVYVQDDSGGMWVDAAAATAPRAGEKVDAVGFAARRAGVPLLEDANFESLGPAPLPAAAAVTAEQALSGAFHARLVRMDALVLEVSRLAEGSTLVLQAGERVFLARLAPAGAGQPDLSAAENSWVRVTGVCVNNRPPDAADADVRPVSFHVMLPGPGSVAVIRTPSWWTLERVLVVVGTLALAALAALAWVVALRRQVVRQTVQIRRHVHQGTIHEERMRIARELHDSLEQDLLAITMQLKATEKQLDRPDRAKAALHLASSMVRRSQAETHRAVWDLREQQAGLVPTLRSAVAGLTTGAAAGDGRDGGGGGAPAVEVRVEGHERELPPQTENHLMRVALEAVTNAFKHAGAKQVTIDLMFEPQRVLLEVRDDGRGFDAAVAPAPSSGHFGLFGMRERAAKLHGELTVVSRAGEGTKIRLVAPTGTNGNGRP